MATPHEEAALRVRLDPSTDAILSKKGVLFVRGRETLWISDKAAGALAAAWTEHRPTLDALTAVLSAEKAEEARDSA